MFIRTLLYIFILIGLSGFSTCGLQEKLTNENSANSKFNQTVLTSVEGKYGSVGAAIVRAWPLEVPAPDKDVSREAEDAFKAALPKLEGLSFTADSGLAHIYASALDSCKTNFDLRGCATTFNILGQALAGDSVTVGSEAKIKDTPTLKKIVLGSMIAGNRSYAQLSALAKKVVEKEPNNSQAVLRWGLLLVSDIVANPSTDNADTRFSDLESAKNAGERINISGETWNRFLLLATWLLEGPGALTTLAASMPNTPFSSYAVAALRCGSGETNTEILGMLDNSSDAPYFVVETRKLLSPLDGSIPCDFANFQPFLIPGIPNAS